MWEGASSGREGRASSDGESRQRLGAPGTRATGQRPGTVRWLRRQGSGHRRRARWQEGHGRRVETTAPVVATSKTARKGGRGPLPQCKRMLELNGASRPRGGRRPRLTVSASSCFKGLPQGGADMGPASFPPARCRLSPGGLDPLHLT